MTTSLRDRRRVERFAQLLDESEGGRRQHLRSPFDDELSTLLTLRHRLVAAPPPARPDPAFRAALRAMLVAAGERKTAPAEPAPVATRATRTPAARAVRARTAVVAGVALGTVAFAGMSAASENAVPGDPLYGVKRSTERAQLALAGSSVGRGRLHLDFARTRLAEALALTGALDTVLDDMDRNTITGVRLLTTAAADRHDPAVLDLIDRFVVGQREALEVLGGRAGDPDRARVAGSAALIDGVEARTADLRRSLEACAGDAIVATDELGPLPDDCVLLPAPGALPAYPPALAQQPPPSQTGWLQAGWPLTAPGEASPDQDLPGHTVPELDLPEQVLENLDFLELDLPDQALPEQILPDILDQALPDQTAPEPDQTSWGRVGSHQAGLPHQAAGRPPGPPEGVPPMERDAVPPGLRR